jgi:hypothetical protein
MGDYQKEQDLIFQEMEDKRRLAEAYERDADRALALAEFGYDIPKLLKSWAVLRKTGRFASVDEFLDKVISAEHAKRNS